MTRIQKHIMKCKSLATGKRDYNDACPHEISFGVTLAEREQSLKSKKNDKQFGAMKGTSLQDARTHSANMKYEK